MRVFDGDPFSGSVTGPETVSLTRGEQGVQSVGEVFTLTTRTLGMNELPFSNRFRLSNNRWNASSDLSFRGLSRASTSSREVKAETFARPLTELVAVEVKTDLPETFGFDFRRA